MAWLNTPSGDHFATNIIRAVVAYPGKGVALRDAQSRLITFIKTDDAGMAVRTRDLVMQAIRGNQGEIDWSFLNEPSASIPAANDEHVDQSAA